MIKARKKLESVVVTAEQMRQIEARIFAAGMPVAALMEKAATLSYNLIRELYPLSLISKVGLLTGPGHNGGDALVVARELHLAGYQVRIYCPFPQLKDLTAQHAQYAQSLGIPFSEQIDSLHDCELLVDGLFGFGLEREISGGIRDAIEQLNQWSQPVVSIDIPSGLHTDTGEVLGVGVRATHSLCLGLWKRAYFQDQALAYIGKAHRLDFGIPPEDVYSILSPVPSVQVLTDTLARDFLPLPRPLVIHKYQLGHLLLICGSRRYAGGAILTGLGARASGVGMLSIAVPSSLKPLLVSHLPEALIIDCPETSQGAIANLPNLAGDFSKYNVIACGPGLTTEAMSVVETVLGAECPLLLDADGLNILAQLGTISSLSKRQYPTVLTPHQGEFKRLFPQISWENGDRIQAVQQAAQLSGAIVLLKGAKTVIANCDGLTWLLGESTPALARGGSGDVLTGLIGGLIAQDTRRQTPIDRVVGSGAWWHAQGGVLAAKERTELGVDGVTLSEYLHRVR